MQMNSGELKLESGNSGYGGFQTFYTAGAERMRIDSSGNLLVGRLTSNNNAGKLQVTANATSSVADFLINSTTGSQNAIDITNSANNSYYPFRFWQNGYGVTSSGSIFCNGSSTAYNTSSDYRLKENISPMTGALDVVQALKPVTYKWKADGSDGQGFIAHELAEVCPDCVTGKKDAVNEDGSIKPQGVDTSFLVATLTAAIQEQQALIKDLTTRLNALEGK
jgi:hypothetical protein